MTRRSCGRSRGGGRRLVRPSRVGGRAPSSLRGQTREKQLRVCYYFFMNTCDVVRIDFFIYFIYLHNKYDTGFLVFHYMIRDKSDPDRPNNGDAHNQ